jgi:Protein of unknown function (DUF1214)
MACKGSGVQIPSAPPGTTYRQDSRSGRLSADCQQITLRDRNITSGVDRFGRLRWYSDAHLREGFPRTSSDRALRAGDDAMAAGERASLSRRRGSGGPTPVTGFWSLTLYNEHHFFHPNQLGRYSLGTKNQHLRPGQGRVPHPLCPAAPIRRRPPRQLAASPSGRLLAVPAHLLAPGRRHRPDLDTPPVTPANH